MLAVLTHRVRRMCALSLRKGRAIMRPYKRKESQSRPGLGTQRIANLTGHEYSRLGSAACTCGGPGGKPGMAPVCRTCLAFSGYARSVEFSRLIGLSRVGFAA